MKNACRRPWMRVRPMLAALLVTAAGAGHHLVATGVSEPYPTGFTGRGSIANTRHNLSMTNYTTTAPWPIGAAEMDSYRNNYGEVCVYCHTPHASESTASVPLWNRRLPAAGSFTTYVPTVTLTQSVTAPGANSLACLSCHDGTTAIDAVMNMPGSGRYNANPDAAFLDTWPNVKEPNGHLNLVQCAACHQPGASMLTTMFAVDFTAAIVGTDLRNDHPVGVRFPGGTPATTGFRDGYETRTSAPGRTITYYDSDGNGRLSPGDVRFYDSGDGAEVECASCHDPHGVAASRGDAFYPTFLRVDTSGSRICQTCHAK